MPILVPGRAIKCQQKLLRGDGDLSFSAPETQSVISPKGLMKPKWLGGKEKSSATISTVATKKPVRTTKIRFNENVRVRATLHVDEITDEEFFQTWYSKDEMKEMKKDMARDLKRWLKMQHREKKGEPTPEEEKNTEFTCRGLEHRTKKGTLQRKRNRFLAVQAVLNEQEEQLVCGVTAGSDDLIRDAYLKGGSKRCTMEAIQFGNEDAKQAQAVYDNQEVEQEVRSDATNDFEDSNVEEQEKQKAAEEKKKKKELMALNLLIDEQLGFGKQEHKTEGTVGLVDYEDLIQPISYSAGVKKKSSAKAEVKKKKTSAPVEAKCPHPNSQKKSKKFMQKIQSSVSSATSSKRRFNVFKN